MDYKDLRLLIVDDEDILVKLLSLRFSRLGFKVSTASGGHEAIEELKNENYDVLITDMRMANGSGLDLLKNISSEEIAGLSIFVMTAFSDVTVFDAFVLGAEGVFAKPINFEAMLSAIEVSQTMKSEQWNRRKPRIPAEISVKFEDRSLDAGMSAKTANVGFGGMFIVGDDQEWTPGEKIQFELRLDHREYLEKVSGRGRIAWVRDEEVDGHPPGVGVEFTEMSYRDRVELVDFINSKVTRTCSDSH